MSNTQQETIETINEVYGDKPASKKSLKEKTPRDKGGKYSKENRKEAKELKKLEKAEKVPKLRRQNAVANIILPKQSKSDDEQDFDVSERTPKATTSPKSPQPAKSPEEPKKSKKTKSPKEATVDEAPEKWDDEVVEKPKSPKVPKLATPVEILTSEISEMNLLSPNSEVDEEEVVKVKKDSKDSKDSKVTEETKVSQDPKTARDARASKALQRITSERKTRTKTPFQDSGKTRVQSKEYSENKGLLCTKACHFCKKNEAGEWGVCSREKCTFAHSLSELQLSQCSFGDNCKRKNGSNSCQFKHPDETNDKYYSRTGIEKPDLPETSEMTRKPKSREESGAGGKNKYPPKDSYKTREPMTSRERAPKEYVKKEHVSREAPVREAPVREAPVREAPVREAPVREAPVREALVREAPVRETSKLAEPIVIHVPSCMKRDALEMCLAKGLTNFQIVLTD